MKEQAYNFKPREGSFEALEQTNNGPGRHLRQVICAPCGDLQQHKAGTWQPGMIGMAVLRSLMGWGATEVTPS